MNFDKLQANIKRVAAARTALEDAVAKSKAAYEDLERARTAVSDAEHEMGESLMDLVEAERAY